jgi:hypothetical protein
MARRVNAVISHGRNSRAIYGELSYCSELVFTYRSAYELVDAVVGVAGFVT